MFAPDRTTTDNGAACLFVLVLVLAVMALAACPQDRPGAEGPRAQGAIQVEDDLHQRLVLQRPARKIASLSPSNTEILFELGCGDRILLRDQLSSYPAAARALPATNAFNLSPEHIAGFSPDLVLLSHADQGRVAGLRRIGLAVATFDPRDLEGLYANIATIGRLCSASTKARETIVGLRARIGRVRAAVRGRPRPRVYVETDGTDPLKPWTAGKGSFVDQLIEIAGGKNIVADLDRPFAQISAEEIFSRDPDVIVVMDVGGAPGTGGQRLRARTGWEDLRAVRSGRIVESIHADLLSRPGPRLVDGLELLARALHPPRPPGTVAP